MSYWSSLIAAYEAELQVLEEGRRAYLGASRSLLERLRAAVGNLDLGPDANISVALEDGAAEPGSVLGEAIRLRARCIKSEELPATELLVWIASAWGGPVGSLRVALALQTLPHPFSAAASRWLRLAHESLPELPGEAFAPDRYLDASENRPWLRIHTVSLSDRDEQAILTEAGDTARSYLAGGLRVLSEIDNAARPLLAAYAALQGQQARVLARAAELGVPAFPGKDGKLRSWQGRDYLQIGRFWVGIDAAAMHVLAEAHEPESEPVVRLAKAVGRPVTQRNNYPSVVLLTEEELRAESVGHVITQAFDTWLSWKEKVRGSEAEGL